jgi:hypothetical protein
MCGRSGESHFYRRKNAVVNFRLKAACLVRVPTEVVKTRMQTSTYGSLAQNSLSAARLLWTADGLRGFYRGYGTTIMREVELSPCFGLSII